jgi:hypothetical protein
MAVEQQDTIPHANQAARLGRCQGSFRIEAAASIFDLQVQRVRGWPNAHRHFGHAGVAGDVGQRFLDHPVSFGLHVDREALFHALMLEIHHHSRLLGVPLEKGQESGHQSQLIQRRGPQVKRQRPYFLKELIDKGPPLL